jgi:SAM-dependent methyltransferase
MPSDDNPIMRERANDLRDEYELIYAEPDPRAYFRVLHSLDYRLPELARPVFREVVRHAAAVRGASPKVLDVGCGFGANAALMRYPVDLDRLAHRYRDLDSVDIDADRLMALDRNYFASWPTHLSADILGYDTAATAAAYAEGTGLVSRAIATDLERDDLDAADRDAIADVNCVVSTGCASYAGPRTFAALFGAIGEVLPWVAMFVLRTETFSELREFFEGRGLVVEKLTGVTFIQRRYHSAAEWTQALLNLETRGVSSSGKEGHGLMHAELFIARPPADAAAWPLDAVVSVSSGSEAHYGGWRGRPWGT